MLNDFPIIKYTILFVLGIIVQSYISLTIQLAILLSSIFIIAFFISKKIKSNKLHNFTLLFFAFTLGLIHYNLYIANSPKYPFKNDYIKNINITGIIKSLSLASNTEIQVDLNHVETPFKSNIDGNFLIKLKNQDINISKINIGDTLKFEGGIFNPSKKNYLWGLKYGNYLTNNGYIGVIYYNRNKEVIIHKNNSFRFAKFVFNVRNKIDNHFKKLFSNSSYGLIRGLLLGDKSLIEDNLKDTYKNTGISHVLAVSGLHVGVVIYLFYLLFARFNIKIRYLLTIISILIFCFVAGSSISVVRASIMGIIFIILKYFNRDYSGLNSLFLTLLIVIIINPLELFNIALQLSFLCALTIIISSGYFNSLIEKVKISNKILIEILRGLYYSVVIQILSLPILLFNFNNVSFVGLLANIIVIPLFSLIIISSILAILISYLWFKLGFIISVTISYFVVFTNYLIQSLNQLSFLNIEIYNINNNQVLIYYLSIILIYLTFKYFKRNIIKISCVIIIIISFFMFYSILSIKYNSSKLYVVFLDVGQGDSFLIKLPNEKAILIDAGNASDKFSSGKDVIIPALKYFNIHCIDYLFISHIDNDHYLGSFDLFGKIPIKCIIKPKLNFNLDKDKEFEKKVRNNKIGLKYYNHNVITLANSKIYILNDSLWRNNTTNESSAIIKLQYGKNSILFMGDASKKKEHLLIKKYGNFIDCDILKVGHHGSKTSTSNQLLKMVTPKYSIISSGINNAYQFPDSSVINRIRNIKSIICRTDIQGTLLFELDGEKIKFLNTNN